MSVFEKNTLIPNIVRDPKKIINYAESTGYKVRCHAWKVYIKKNHREPEVSGYLR